MIISIIAQGVSFDKILTSLLFYNVNLKNKYDICLICNSNVKKAVQGYMIKFDFDLKYKILEPLKIFDFYKDLYKIQKELINEYGSLLLVNTSALLINEIDISEKLLEQKLIVKLNNDIISKTIFYISDENIIDRMMFLYDNFVETTTLTNLRDISREIFNMEIEIIKDFYDKYDYKYFTHNNLVSSLYRFTKEGNENQYIDWDKFTYKDDLIQFYDIEYVYNPIHNNLLSKIINSLISKNHRYYYIFMLTRTDVEISIPIRNIEYGLWKDTNNNSFDFIAKDFVSKHNNKFLYNFLTRTSNTEFFKNNVIYDKKSPILLDKYTLTYDSIFLVNTDKSVLDFLDDINKKSFFIGYIPYCKPLLDEYIVELDIQKTIDIIDISNTVYDDNDIQKYINSKGIINVISTRKPQEDIKIEDISSNERIKHKELYFEHLNKIKDSKYVKLNIDDNRFINTLIECMILESIPILNKDPNLIDLYEGVNYIIDKDDIIDVTNSNNIILNNVKYYNENVNIDHCLKMLNHLI